MIALRAGEIADLTGGRLHQVDADRIVTGPASVDSRAVDPGGLFVAVAGEHVDGHDYAAAATDAGAALTLTARPVDAPCVIVADPVEALGRVAADVVARLPDMRVIGLTGSQGKTSTKDLLAQILQPHGPTVATSANLNNEIGVPLTVTRAAEDTRFLVVEMGARQVGNIAYLCTIAPPQVGVVLNVGVAHVGEFGSQEAIARTKGELVEALGPDGHAVVNADDPLVAAMRTRTTAAVSTFGEAADADVAILDLDCDADGRPGFVLTYAGERVDVRLDLLGRHQALNAAAAAAAALAVGIELDEVAAGLNTAQSTSAWRMERHRLADDVVLINDAYNANPDSMRAALDTASAIATARGTRVVAVLGEMLELGDESTAEHRALGSYAADTGIAELIVVGAGASPIAATWSLGEAPVVADAAAALRTLEERIQPGDVVLVKASRASGLERVAAELLAGARHTSSGARQGAGERTR